MKADAMATGVSTKTTSLSNANFKYLGLSSAVTLQLADLISLENLVELFSDGSPLTGHRTRLSVINDGIFEGLVLKLVEAQPPYLRHVRLEHFEPSTDNLTKLFAAAIASPYLETIEVMWAPTNRTWMAVPHDYRPDTDEEVPLTFVFHSPTYATRELRRTVPLVKVVDIAVAANPGPTTPTVVLRIHGVDSPPLRLDRLRFAEVLKVTQKALDPAVDGLFHVGTDGVITLPSKYVNSSGAEDVEDRFGVSDVAILVRWMNDFASDEVHAMLTALPVATHEPPRYFVSLVGFEFFKEFICAPGRRPIDNLRRTIKVLAAAHFLGVVTLANLLMSILNSPHAQFLLFEDTYPR